MASMHQRFYTKDEIVAKGPALAALFAEGCSIQECIRRMELGKKIIYRIMYEANVVRPPQCSKQDQNQAKLTELFAAGHSLNECIQLMGLKRSTLFSIRKRGNLPMAVKKTAWQTRREKLLELLESGKSFRECGAILECTWKACVSIARRGGFAARFTSKGNVCHFTQERDDIIRDAFPVGELNEEIAIRCNALPGPLVTKKQVSSRAIKLNLKRPDGWVKPTGKGPNKRKIKAKDRQNGYTAWRPKIYRSEHDLPADPLPNDWMPGGMRLPVDRSWPDIQKLAANEGWWLTGYHDLPGYNRSRNRRGLAPYAIKKAGVDITQWR